ncbi:unnamed protein product [Paramecium octaurelia]|uniref:Uncharacterized protein n=1 Tax=Paramecium octaurelia TaxID=43137 RepID=A0A8S1YIL2_PAROT|nr:unnamed protein product [Paramecium octaurelia]
MTSTNTNNEQPLNQSQNNKNLQFTQVSTNTNNEQPLNQFLNTKNLQFTQASTNTNNQQPLNQSQNNNNIQLTQVSTNSNNEQPLNQFLNNQNLLFTQVSTNTNNEQPLNQSQNNNNIQFTQVSTNTNNEQPLNQSLNNQNIQFTQVSTNINNDQPLNQSPIYTNVQFFNASTNTNYEQKTIYQTQVLNHTHCSQNNQQSSIGQQNQFLPQRSYQQNINTQTQPLNTSTFLNSNTIQPTNKYYYSNQIQFQSQQPVIYNIPQSQFIPQNETNISQQPTTNTSQNKRLLFPIFIPTSNSAQNHYSLNIQDDSLFDDYNFFNLSFLRPISPFFNANLYGHLNQQQNKNKDLNTKLTSAQYNYLIYIAEKHLYQQWKEYKKPFKSINKTQIRIIVIDQNAKQKFLENFGQLLLQLSFLNLNYDVILSGQIQPVFLKRKEEALTISLLDEILHALIGQSNKDFSIVNENSINNNDVILLFTEQLLEISNNCRTELQNEGFSTIIQIQDQNQFNAINIKNGQIISSSNNLFEFLNQIEKKSPLMKKQRLQGNQEKEELKQKLNEYGFQIDPQEANSLKGLLEINTFTKYSLSSKGTTIDIKGIIKFFCTNGTARDIMKRKNRGGKSLYVFYVILDLSSIQKETLLDVVLPFLSLLIEICKQYQLICNLMILNNPLIIIKSNFSTLWTDYEYTILIEKLIDYQNEASADNTDPQFQQIFDEFERFCHYKKYLIFINHSFYDYQFKELQQLINMAQQKQIKIISIGVDIKKYINRSFEGIIQYSLNHSKELFKIIKNMFSKVLEQEKFNGNFQFQQNNQQYPRKLQLKQYCSQQGQVNCYMNKYFNYQKEGKQNQDKQIALIDGELFLFLSILELRRVQREINNLFQNLKK